MPSTSLNPQQIPDRLNTLPTTGSPVVGDKVSILAGGVEKLVTIESLMTLAPAAGTPANTDGFDTVSSVTYRSDGKISTLVSDGTTYTFLYNATTGELYQLQTAVHEWTIARDINGQLTSITKVTRDYIDPVISVVSYGTPGEASVTITWTTDEVSTSQVEYGLSVAYGTLTTIDPAYVTSHSVTITGLSLNTLYYFRVKSGDPTGNVTTGDGYTFTTLEDNYIYLFITGQMNKMRLGAMSTHSTYSTSGDVCVLPVCVGQYVYVVNATDQTIDKIDSITMTKIASLATTSPVQSICTNGTDLFYTMSNGTVGWIVKITISTFTVFGTTGGTFNIGGPLAADSSYVYCARIGAGACINRVDASTLSFDGITISGTVAVSGYSNMVINAGFLYVPLTGSSVKKINLGTWANVGDAAVGTTPQAMVASGLYVYVCNYGSSTISRLRISDYTVIDSLAINLPESIRAFGGNLYVTSNTDNTLKKIAELGFSVASTAALGADPKGLFII